MPDKPPTPVEVVAPSPIPVAVVAAAPAPAPPLVPERIQDQHDATFAGQRRVNLIWEATQAAIAIGVTLAVLWVSSSLAMKGETATAAFMFLSNAFSLIIGFYFSRTNHTQIGGVGDKPRPPYEGR